MKQEMKVLVISMFLLGNSPVFAEDVNQRIAFLEQEVQSLKAQQKLENVDQSTQQNTKSVNVFSDTNIKFYGIVRMDGAVDFKDTTAAPFVSNQTPAVDRSPAGNRSAFTLTATRLGMDMSKKVNTTDIKAKIEINILYSFFISLSSHIYINLLIKI